MKRMTTKEIQDVSLEILKTIDEFCQAHKIRYWLDSGTLIGAIRHRGFIPWDDDLDICMPRPDYERFLNEYKDSAKYKLYAPEKRNCFLFYARLCEMEKTFFQVNAKWATDNPGVGVDIFPVNGAPDTIEEFDTVLELTQKNREALLEYRRLFKVQRFRRSPWGFAKDCVHVISKFTRRAIWRRHIMSLLAEQVELFRKYDYEKSSHCYYLALSMSRKKYWKRAWFDKLIEVDFCGEKFMAPSGYDERLSAEYGDYMTPPPKSEQVVHSAWQTMWWRN